MVLLLSATADFSVGPVVYTIVSELPSTWLCAKTIVLARNAYNIINLAFVNIISYRQFNQNAWNWGPEVSEARIPESQANQIDIETGMLLLGRC